MNREHSIEKVELMNEAELISLIGQLKNKLKTVEASYGGMPKMFEDHKQLYENFIEDLLAQKNRFVHIFKTEKGSIYFVIQDGKSLRIKDFKYGYELQPLSDEMTFIQEGSKEHATSLIVGSTPYETFRIQRGEKTDELHHKGHKVTEILK